MPPRKKKEASPYQHIVGKAVSLNLKEESYFFCGDIALTPEKWWATISPGFPDEYYQTILSAISSGHIVFGKERIEPIDKDQQVLTNWWEMIRRSGDTPLVREALKRLIHKGGEGNYTLEEIVTHCLKNERNGPSRPDVITLLETAMSYVEKKLGGNLEVTEEEGKSQVLILRNKDGDIIIKRKTDEPSKT